MLSRLNLTGITVDSGIGQTYGYTAQLPPGSPVPTRYYVFNFNLALDPNPEVPAPWPPPPVEHVGPPAPLPPPPPPTITVTINNNVGMDLNFTVKVPEANGLDRGLEEARQAIAGHLLKLSSDLQSQVQG